MRPFALVPCWWFVPPSQLPLLVAIIGVFLLVVLVFLYRSATVLSRRILARLLLVMAIVFVAAEAVVLVRLRGPERRPYLAVFPVAPGRSSPEAWALSLTLSHQLRRVTGNYYAVPFASVLQAVQADSCTDQGYIARFCVCCGIDAAVAGELVAQGERRAFICRLWYRGQWSDTTVNASEFDVRCLADAAQNWLATKLNIKHLPSAVPPLRWGVQTAATDLLVRDGKFGQARAALGPARDPVVLWMVGQSYLQQAKELRALGKAWREPLYHGIAAAEELVQRDSSSLEGNLLLAECRILEEDWDRAEIHLRKAFSLDPSYSHALLLLSRLHPSRYRDLGFEDEEQLYRRAICYDPCAISARLALVGYLREMGRRTEALQEVDEILRLNPTCIQGLLAKGRMLITWEQNEAGFACLEEARRLAPDDPEVLYALGVARYVTEDFEGARPLFARAIALGDHLDSYLYLGLIARRQGQPEQALHYFQERVRRKRDGQDRLADIARDNIFQITH